MGKSEIKEIPNQAENCLRETQRSLIAPKGERFSVAMGQISMDLRAWKIFRSRKKARRCYLGVALLLSSFKLSNGIPGANKYLKDKASTLTFPENIELTRTSQQLFS